MRDVLPTIVAETRMIGDVTARLLFLLRRSLVLCRLLCHLLECMNIS